MTDRSDKTPQRRRVSYRQIMLNELPIRHVLRRLRNVQEVTSGQYTASCPVCDGAGRHLTVTEEADGKVLMYCHHDRGCTIEAILDKIGLEMADLFGDEPLNSQPQKSISGHARPGLARNADRMSADRPTAVAESDPAMESSDWASLSKEFQAALTMRLKAELDMELRLEHRYLTQLRLGWSATGNVYTWPEVDGHGRVIGIATRKPVTGEKGFLAGGHRGLYIPTPLLRMPARRSRSIYIVEGPTDTAGMLAMGLLAIGRPSARSGGDHLAEWLGRHASDRKIIVVGEIDPKSDGTWTGRDAAEAVAQQLSAKLRRNVSWTLPPDNIKDVRAWYIRWRGM